MDLEMTQVTALRQDLSSDEKTQFDVQFASRRKEPTTALILGILFGYWGIDRFYLGQIGLGILKLVTIGGLLVWWIIDWFLIMDAARVRNVEIAREVRAGMGQPRTKSAGSFCGACGAPAAPDSAFCGKCGAKVG